MGAKAQTIRDQLHHLADELPTDATWKDVLYEAYFRQEVEAGLAEGDKCQRCWMVLPDVGDHEHAPETCGRCADAVAQTRAAD